MKGFAPTGDGAAMKKTQRSILKFLLTVLAVVTAVFVIYIWQERFKNSNNKPAII